MKKLANKKHWRITLSALFAVCIIATSSKSNYYSTRLYQKYLRIIENTKRINEQQKSPYKLNRNGGCVQLEKDFVLLLNKHRAELNKKQQKNNSKEPLSILKTKTTLTKAARKRAEEMLANGIFSHTRPNGKSFDTIFEERGCAPAGRRVMWGEIIQMGKSKHLPTATQIFDAFKNSKSHYEAMKMPGYMLVGAGLRATRQKDEEGSYAYVWYFCVLFATTVPG
jgi:uncharacterized protein YkwD